MRNEIRQLKLAVREKGSKQISGGYLWVLKAVLVMNFSLLYLYVQVLS